MVHKEKNIKKGSKNFHCLKEEKLAKLYKLLYNNSSDAIMTLEPPSWKFIS